MNTTTTFFGASLKKSKGINKIIYSNFAVRKEQYEIKITRRLHCALVNEQVSLV